MKNLRNDPIGWNLIIYEAPVFFTVLYGSGRVPGAVSTVESIDRSNQLNVEIV